MLNVVIYCRVSSDEQAQRDLSIPAQRKALIRWVNENPECKLVAEFIEEGESAYHSADRRPKFQEMISLCRKNKEIDTILVHKLDRFSRNREESIIFKALLRKHGVTVRSISEPFDPDTPQGMLFEGMIETINQFYSANLATETLKGMKENAERGWNNGGRVPFGYRLEQVTNENGRTHSKLTLGPEDEVSVVREIFDMSVSQSLGIGAIVNILNGRELPSPLGGHWNKSSIGNILKNRAYMGDRVWNRRGKNHTIANPKDDWVIAENAHEPIVDKELFQKRQVEAKKRRFDVGDRKLHSVNYLLSRLIKCESCGHNFVGKGGARTLKDGTRHRLYYYRCGGGLSKGKHVCSTAPSIRADWFDAQVIMSIRDQLCSQENLKKLSSLIKEKIEERRRKFQRNPRAVEQKLANIDKSIDNYYRAIGEGLDPLVCKQKIKELENRKEKLLEEAAELQRENYYQSAMERVDTEIQHFAEAFSQSFEALPFNIKRSIILRFIDGIRITQDKVAKVEVKVPFDHEGYRLLTEGIESNSDGSAPIDWASEKFPSGPSCGAMIRRDENSPQKVNRSPG